jgi:hypothetical protein
MDTTSTSNQKTSNQQPETSKVDKQALKKSIEQKKAAKEQNQIIDKNKVNA